MGTMVKEGDPFSLSTYLLYQKFGKKSNIKSLKSII